MEKVKWKAGLFSSWHQHSYDGSLLQTLHQSSSSRCRSYTRQAQHCHSTFPHLPSRDLNLNYRGRAQHHEQSWSQFDAYKAGNSTAWTSQHSTGQMIHRGLSSENKSRGCCQQSTAAGITKPEAKRVDNSWSCESDDESADDKHHKQEELPTSFTDRFGTDQKTSKKDVIAPLPSPRRKLCLENKDGNTENVYLIFPEEALCTHKHLDFHALVPWCNRCWWNALLLSLIKPVAHQNHTKLSTWSQIRAPTHQLHQQNRTGDDTPSSHCLCSTAFK